MQQISQLMLCLPGTQDVTLILCFPQVVQQLEATPSTPPVELSTLGGLGQLSTLGGVGQAY